MLESGSHRLIKKRKYSKSKRRSFLLLLLPAFFILVWLFLHRQIAISSTAQVSPQHLQSSNKVWIPPIVDKRLDGTSKIVARTPRTRKKRRKVIQPDSQQQQQQQDHHHIIPNILIFTHVINLWTNETVTTTNTMNDDDDERAALQANVRHTVQLHPGAEVRFLTNPECTRCIQRVMGEASPLVNFFQRESQGMFKADICRGAALYETGGLYLDVDLQARMNLWQAISPKTEFVVPRVHAQSKYPGAFFQAFIGVTPRHAIMKRYLELFVDYYQGKLGEMKGPLGVLLLRRAHDDVVGVAVKENEDASSNIELWQEVLYSQRLFPNVAPPSWGTRRACHFVVVANRKPPFIVPFYSRVKGSRMCGGKESHPTKLRGHLKH